MLQHPKHILMNNFLLTLSEFPMLWDAVWVRMDRFIRSHIRFRQATSTRKQLSTSITEAVPISNQPKSSVRAFSINSKTAELCSTQYQTISEQGLSSSRMSRRATISCSMPSSPAALRTMPTKRLRFWKSPFLRLQSEEVLRPALLSVSLTAVNTTAALKTMTLAPLQSLG